MITREGPGGNDVVSGGGGPAGAPGGGAPVMVFRTERVEGGPPPHTIIIVEFPTMQRLREWYASPEYAEALRHRRTALDRRLIFVEGVPPV